MNEFIDFTIRPPWWKFWVKPIKMKCFIIPDNSVVDDIKLITKETDELQAAYGRYGWTGEIGQLGPTIRILTTAYEK